MQLCFVCYQPLINAQVVAADWTSQTAGTVDGISYTAPDFTGFSNLGNFDLSGSDYSAAPLSNNQEVVNYDDDTDWTLNFSAPVYNLRIYIVFWRTASDGIFSESSGTLLSGTNLILNGGDTVDATQYGNGIVEFSGPITSLSFDSSNTNPFGGASIAMTFSGSSTPLSAATDVPTLSEWGLIIL
ncbi:MAG: hypothetical protein ACPG49_12910, partial [Chitinophagales bacterium]